MEVIIKLKKIVLLLTVFQSNTVSMFNPIRNLVAAGILFSAEILKAQSDAKKEK